MSENTEHIDEIFFELFSEILREKDSNQNKSRNWSVLNTELEKVFAYYKTYCE
jgi:CRISPR/Cas system CSM-associated protein Csm2 small subunit